MSEKENLIDDMMRKQLNNLSKKQVIELFLRERNLRKKLSRKLSKLNTVAYCDAPTTNAVGRTIYNRTYLENVFINSKNHSSCIVCMVDVNDLAITNNTLGHLAGDQLICDCALSLVDYGTVIRFGGDEFILVPDKDKVDAFKQMLNDKKDTLNFSYGMYEKQPSESFEEALNKADEIMYNMKFQKKVGRDYHRQR